MLDLVHDCFRFVTGYFGIISTSSQHIYHSALISTPKSSIVRRIYESRSQPLTRVVHGIQATWDPAAATGIFPPVIRLAVWSPCNRFIAIITSLIRPINILVSATLQKLRHLASALVYPETLIFSPDSRMLTSSGFFYTRKSKEVLVVTWNIQTGGVVSIIRREEPRSSPNGSRIVYSMNGKMVGVLYWCNDTQSSISIYDVVSGVYMHDIGYHMHVRVDSRWPPRPNLCDVWTYEGYLRFAAIEEETIALWEVGFAPGSTPTKIETLPLPSDLTHVPLDHIQWLPASCRLAFLLTTPTVEVLVWDARDSKFLLRHSHCDSPAMQPQPSNDVGGVNLGMSFSSDGRFFACSAAGPEVYLWKETPTGYTFHGTLAAASKHSSLVFPLSGELIITMGGPIIQLWHARYPTSTSPSTLTHAPRPVDDFVLEFLPDKSMAMVARQKQNMVTLLDLESGLPQSTIESPMDVCGLGAVENVVIVIGNGDVITWNLPGRGPLPDAEILNILDSDRLMHFWRGSTVAGAVAGTVSPDFRYIVLADPSGVEERVLFVYDAITKQPPYRASVMGSKLWFAPGGQDIWSATGKEAEVLTVTSDGLDCTMRVDDIEDGSQECPWRSSRGYRVTSDGWVLSPDGRRLLMLPPAWQSSAAQRVWNGRFLALLHGSLPEPVILDLEPRAVTL